MSYSQWLSPVSTWCRNTANYPFQSYQSSVDPHRIADVPVQCLAPVLHNAVYEQAWYTPGANGMTIPKPPTPSYPFGPLYANQEALAGSVMGPWSLGRRVALTDLELSRPA